MVLWDGLRGPIAARRQTVLPRSLCVTVPGAALLLLFGTEGKEKIYARPTYGSNKQFLMQGDDLTCPVRVYLTAALVPGR